MSSASKLKQRSAKMVFANIFMRLQIGRNGQNGKPMQNFTRKHLFRYPTKFSCTKWRGGGGGDHSHITPELKG